MSLAARQSKEKSPYLPRKARIEETFPVTGKEMFFRITPHARIKYAPGQFLMAGLPGCGEAPFSISSASGEKTIELCVRAVGNVTRALHGLKKGATMWIRGPFGKGFDVEKMKGKDLRFIAGGIGLVQMRSLIKTVLSKRNLFGRLTLLYGVKEPYGKTGGQPQKVRRNPHGGRVNNRRTACPRHVNAEREKGKARRDAC